MRKLLPILLVLSFYSYAQENPVVLRDNSTVDDVISEKYDTGPYLIYDCEDKHWVCVQPSYFENCKKQRKRDLASAEKLHHSCSPIGKFPTKKSCFQRQLFLTTHFHGNRFCIKDEWKEKNVKF